MNKLDREFAYGSSLLNPAKAVLPGLVYDKTERDYIGFQCKQGYNTTTLRKLSRDKIVCRTTTHGRGWDLNYPSFAVAVEDGHEINTSFFRTVTNVRLPNSTYHVRIEKPDFIDIKAQPSVLSFNVVGEKKSFIVKVNGPQISQVPILSASVTREDGVHVVWSPLMIYTVLGETLANNNEDKASSVPKAVLAGDSFMRRYLIEKN